MSKSPSLQWLFVRLPVDPDVADLLNLGPLSTTTAATLVAIGGVAGSLLRASVGSAVAHPTTGWPWSTVIVNVVGSGALAFVLVLLLERFPRARLPRPLIGTGLIGGFTTFSTFAVDTVHLSRGGRPVMAVLYVVATLIGTGLAAVAGLCAARAFDRLHDQQRWARRVHHALSPDAEANRS